ncbi:ubiquitin carboxyl-terminal hydrolase CYLD-like isoform X1 [Lethenteron reissneri]|uniref:ubiquitin carboxyl-terminal hydrolase CYLD-like isoform X1 n=1 Tax=Lethenteron reissneri TaxID=7753 RepID=UPI002AB7E592|nr:ubiquitin carboxyl-terminal hydrolase CYLD-like isoform X1 [Lethenteron reissneri]
MYSGMRGGGTGQGVGPGGVGSVLPVVGGKSLSGGVGGGGGRGHHRASFFILLKDQDVDERCGPVPKGSICFTADGQDIWDAQGRTMLAVTFVDYLDTIAKVLPKALKRCCSELEEDLALCLIAMPSREDRLRVVGDAGRLEMLRSLRPGAVVRVNLAVAGPREAIGVVRYCGPLDDRPFSGTSFGIELQGYYRGKGVTDGTYSGKRFFTCDEECGVFVHLNRIVRLESEDEKDYLYPERVSVLDSLSLDGNSYNALGLGGSGANGGPSAPRPMRPRSTRDLSPEHGAQLPTVHSGSRYAAGSDLTSQQYQKDPSRNSLAVGKRLAHQSYKAIGEGRSFLNNHMHNSGIGNHAPDLKRGLGGSLVAPGDGAADDYLPSKYAQSAETSLQTGGRRGGPVFSSSPPPSSSPAVLGQSRGLGGRQRPGSEPASQFYNTLGGTPIGQNSQTTWYCGSPADPDAVTSLGGRFKSELSLKPLRPHVPHTWPDMGLRSLGDAASVTSGLGSSCSVGGGGSEGFAAVPFSSGRSRPSLCKTNSNIAPFFPAAEMVGGRTAGEGRPKRLPEDNGPGPPGGLTDPEAPPSRPRTLSDPAAAVAANLGGLVDRSPATPPTPLSPSPVGGKYELEKGSLVEVMAKEMRVFGVIRWIGVPLGLDETLAGIELEEEMQGCTDGTFKQHRFFTCPLGKGFFIQFTKCRPDSRFMSVPHIGLDPVQRCNSLAFSNYRSERVEGEVPPPSEKEATAVVCGRTKGIQGHYNSCYLDSTLFCMFAFSTVFDGMLHRPQRSSDLKDYPKVQQLLREDIVNPLRKNGFVSATKVMQLRKQLDKIGYVTGLTCEEKDPEEFLNTLFQHVLKVEPFLKIRSGNKDFQDGHFYQIFTERDEQVKVPTVQQLLEQSFLAADLKLVETPSCLIVQMPRFGKDFKMFNKIIPSLELDITDLLEDAPRECHICGGLAEEECKDCYHDPRMGPSCLKQFCSMCNKQVHNHPDRQQHRSVRKLVVTEEVRAAFLGPGRQRRHGGGGCLGVAREKLELFAVLCIQTSHYVAFAKHGPAPQSWLFFDSMADREGGQEGFNIPEVRECPEVAQYLSMRPEELDGLDPRVMEGPASRLLCDAYMCMYQHRDMMLYK